MDGAARERDGRRRVEEAPVVVELMCHRDDLEVDGIKVPEDDGGG